MNYCLSIPQTFPEFRDYISSLPKKLDQLGIFSSIKENISGDRCLYLLTCRLRRRAQEKEIRRVIATFVAGFICERYEKVLIHELIRKHPMLTTIKERKEVEDKVKQRLEQNAWKYLHVHYSDRKERLIRPLVHFLKESRMLAVDGYVRFRLQSYRKALEKCIQDTVDEYLLDREYQDFIQLLKYFVQVQTSRVSLIHVIHKKRREFALFHPDGTPYRTKGDEDWTDSGSTHADLIVSSLLSIAPERIILHTQSPDEKIIRTLCLIFEGRILLCEGCQECALDGSSTDYI